MFDGWHLHDIFPCSSFVENWKEVKEMMDSLNHHDESLSHLKTYMLDNCRLSASEASNFMFAVYLRMFIMYKHVIIRFKYLPQFYLALDYYYYGSNDEFQ